MYQPLYVLTAVDLRRAEQSGSSRATTIDKMTIPPIKFVTASHNPGGGAGAVDFTLPRIEALEPAMSVKGIDRDIFSGMGVTEKWTFAAAYRDKKTGVAVPARGIIQGAITEWEPDESDPEDFQGCSHTFKEVTHFELLFDGKELFYFDFWERELRRDGVDLFADDKQALGA